MHDLLCQNKHKRLHKQNMQQSYDMKHIQCMPVTLTQQVRANQVSNTTWYTLPKYVSYTDPTSLSQSGVIYHMIYTHCMPVTLTQQVWANQVSYTTGYTPIVWHSHWPNKLEPIRWHVPHDIHPLYVSYTDPTSLSQSGDTYHMIHIQCIPVTLTQQVWTNILTFTTWYIPNVCQLHWPNTFEPIRSTLHTTWYTPNGI